MHVPEKTPRTPESAWDLLYPDFPPTFRSSKCSLDGLSFRVVLADLGAPLPPVRLKTGLGLLACPRPKTFRHRFVLVPDDDPADVRWAIDQKMITGFILWSRRTCSVTTFSTYKAGASTPWSVHGQSIPWRFGQERLTALNAPEITRCLTCLADFGEMPGFHGLKLERLGEPYVAPALRVTWEDSEVGPQLAARKLFEFSLGYDHLLSVNFVVVPEQRDMEPAIFIFPRARSGRATFRLGARRWQVSAFEVAGLLAVTTEEELETVANPDLIREIFRHVAPSSTDLDDFFGLVESF